MLSAHLLSLPLTAVWVASLQATGATSNVIAMPLPLPITPWLLLLSSPKLLLPPANRMALRRPPTRVELKADDIDEYEQVSKLFQILDGAKPLWALTVLMYHS